MGRAEIRAKFTDCPYREISAMEGYRDAERSMGTHAIERVAAIGPLVVDSVFPIQPVNYSHAMEPRNLSIGASTGDSIRADR